MAIVNGFAGLRVTGDGLSIDPFLPEGLNGYSFPFAYRGRRLKLSVQKDEISLELISGEALGFSFRGEEQRIEEEKLWTYRL